MQPSIHALEERSGRADEAVTLGIGLLAPAIVTVVVVGVACPERRGCNGACRGDGAGGYGTRSADGPAHGLIAVTTLAHAYALFLHAPALFHPACANGVTFRADA